MELGLFDGDGKVQQGPGAVVEQKAQVSLERGLWLGGVGIFFVGLGALERFGGCWGDLGGLAWGFGPVLCAGSGVCFWGELGVVVWFCVVVFVLVVCLVGWLVGWAW